MQQQNSVNCQKKHWMNYQSTSFKEIKIQYREELKNRHRCDDDYEDDDRDDDDPDCYCE